MAAAAPQKPAGFLAGAAAFRPPVWLERIEVRDGAIPDFSCFRSGENREPQVAQDGRPKEIHGHYLPLAQTSLATELNRKPKSISLASQCEYNTERFSAAGRRGYTAP